MLEPKLMQRDLFSQPFDILTSFDSAIRHAIKTKLIGTGIALQDCRARQPVRSCYSFAGQSQDELFKWICILTTCNQSINAGILLKIDQLMLGIFHYLRQWLEQPATLCTTEAGTVKWKWPGALSTIQDDPRLQLRLPSVTLHLNPTGITDKYTYIYNIYTHVYIYIHYIVHIYICICVYLLLLSLLLFITIIVILIIIFIYIYTYI